MSLPTHIITSGDGTQIFIGDNKTQYFFLTPLQAFDGISRCGRSLARLPKAGMPDDFTQQDLDLAARHYLQAGGSADRMTIEIRKDVPGGSQSNFVVGHQPTDEPGSQPDTPIQVGEHQHLVYKEEVFQAAEAAELFFFYYNNDSLPGSYSLRKINVAD